MAAASRIAPCLSEMEDGLLDKASDAAFQTHIDSCTKSLNVSGIYNVPPLVDSLENAKSSKFSSYDTVISKDPILCGEVRH